MTTLDKTALETATTREFIEAVHDIGTRIFTGQIGTSQEPDAARGLGEMFTTAYLDALSSLPAQAVDLRTLVPGFRLDWSRLRNRFEGDALRLEKLTTYESRVAYLDEMARQFEDAVNTALAPSQPAAVGVTDEMVEAAHQIYTDKVREYDRDFNSDTERAQWRAKYGSNLHSTSRGERWAMKQALEAALRSTP